MSPKMKNFLLDLFFPKHCLGCRKEGWFICPACLEKIPINHNPAENIGKIKLRAASFYEYSLLKQAIHKFKYEFVRELAEPLAKLMIERINQPPIGQNLILVPVPLHPRRLRWRGFNQAELLAQAVSRELNLPMASNLLIRTKHNLPQMKIKDSQSRKENIKAAFILNPRVILSLPEAGEESRGIQRCHSRTPCALPVPVFTGINFAGIQSFSNKTIVLIDDISTSGATLSECARTLKPLKPKEIWGLVLARG